MLLQESVASSDVPRTRFVHREIAGRRPSGSSFVAFDKELVVQFQYMAAPYDTLNARKELWSD